MHQTIVTCEENGVKGVDAVWDCSRSKYPRRTDMMHADECSGAREQALFSVRETGEGIGLRYPTGMGVPVGGDTGRNYIVLRTHFPRPEDLPSGGWIGHPGITFTAVDPQMIDRDMKTVGSLKGYALGVISPHSMQSATGFYPIHEKVTLHLIAVAAHTHMHGVDSRLAKIGKDGRRTVIIRLDPMQPEVYHEPEDNNVTLTTGDSLEWMCVYNNTSPHSLVIP